MPEKTPKVRVIAIDAFRALTMMLMIFVNDFWTLEGVPKWMEHAKASEDYLGLSDVVFPAFLFIVGLSIPFAITNRLKKGDSILQVLFHIGSRSFALILMGFFMVNLENINRESLAISKYIYQFMMALAFLLIWNLYELSPNNKPLRSNILKAIGVVILIILAILYKGGSPEEIQWMKPHWWGILGLIGWSYLYCAILYVIFRNRIIWFAILWVVGMLLNVQEFTGLGSFSGGIKFVVSASNYTFTLGGVLTSVIMIHLKNKGKMEWFVGILILLGVITLVFGIATRPQWGISKIGATPSWTAICTGISLIFLALLYVVTDILKFQKWLNIIKPAGTSTLTCYIVPYFYYAIMAMIGVYLPIVLRTGGVGIIKSILFSLLIIQITGLLERINVKMKI
jgi:predicted acyltransferase